MILLENIFVILYIYDYGKTYNHINLNNSVQVKKKEDQMNIKYHINPEFDQNLIKLNNQQKQIVKILTETGKTEFVKSEIISALDGKLTTRQSGWLVFKFYQPHFVHHGFLTLTRELNPPIIRKTVKTV